MAVTVHPLSPALGAEIRGVDLSRPLDEPTVRAIYDAWLAHQVIVFRDQTMSDEDHIRFGNHMGKVGEYKRPKTMRSKALADYHESVMLVSNIREDGEPIGALPDGEMMFHTDTTYDQKPHKATTLYAIEIPSRGGETLFANQYMAYDALPAAIRERLDGCVAYNAYEFGTTIKTKERYDAPEMRSARHPVFLRHPETGRMALYVNELMTEQVEGLDEAESRRLLEEIFALQKRPEFLYEHRWRVGDLVMWDNRCTLHARRDFPREERRLLRRITVEDGAMPRAA
jgi:taurine dioxygenase